jgi:primosomal protein N' (replication factor Y)
MEHAVPPAEMIASVLLDDALNAPLDYAVPAAWHARVLPGVRALVPVRDSLRRGTILELKRHSSVGRLRPIAELLSDAPLFSRDLLALAEWMAHYYATPLRAVLKVFLPPSVKRGQKEKRQLFVEPLLSRPALQELCAQLRAGRPAQALVLDALLQAPKGILLTRLLKETGASQSSVNALVKQNAVRCRPIEIDRTLLLEQEFFQTAPKPLLAEQATALSRIRGTIDAGAFAVHLLHGVTGSGKTEVYLQAIEHTLKCGKGSILLVPEIALTAQTVERLRGRFAEKIAVLHCRLSDGERRDAWEQIRKGEAPLVIGARSALFSPVPNVGLIIVDEEHEPSYKQSGDPPLYHARDVAVMRGKLAGAAVVLGSATPSLESLHNARTGKYVLSTLTARAASALPTIRLIDMRRAFDKAQGFTLFSEELLDAIRKRLETGEQTLLFLNRRGYHSAQTCARCSHVMQCPHCDVSLTYHRGPHLLACHLCDYRLAPPPRACPGCDSVEGLKFKGAGTELVERSLHAIFPGVRTLRLDADTTSHKGSHDLLFKQFRSGKADVMIGTQMIAKGLHFPSVTLVGVLNADASLSIPDFRASEHVFQLITQVSGRSGRGALPGEVFIQTSLPDHPAIACAAGHNGDSFVEQELAVRKEFGYPPYTRLMKFTFSGADPLLTEQTAAAWQQAFVRALPSEAHILPVTPCGHAKIKDRWRFQFLLKAPSHAPALAALAALYERLPLGRAVRLSIDVDPLSTFF